jgi:plasmid stability protein
MPSYILRDIDDALWRRVKSRAALEGTTVKALIEQLLRAWVDAAPG